MLKLLQSLSLFTLHAPLTYAIFSPFRPHLLIPVTATYGNWLASNYTPPLQLYNMLMNLFSFSCFILISQLLPIETILKCINLRF